MFGVRVPKLSLSLLKDKWVLGGLAAGAAIYLMTTKTMTGFQPLDRTLMKVGDLTHIEGVFINKSPASWVHTPGKTTVVHQTPATRKIGPATVHPGTTPSSSMHFSGAGELQRRLTIT